SRPRLRGAEQWRPVCRAGSVAGTFAVLVVLEQIERASACVDEDSAERRLPERDKRSLRRRRRCRARVAEGGSDEHGPEQCGRGGEECDLAFHFSSLSLCEVEGLHEGLGLY